MSIRCSKVIQILKEIAPEKLAQDWDNVGLLVGNLNRDINKIMITLDVTPEVVNEAVKNKIDLIISHHPVIFKPLNNLRLDNPQNKMLAMLLQHDIAVYSAHTNLDIVVNGVSDVLAQKLGVAKLEILQETEKEKLYKLVVYVPQTHTTVVREVLGKKGAGFIGNYSHCSFKTAGIGAFKPGEGTKPFLGEIGGLQEVEEDRLETIVPESILQSVLQGMLEVHPYEEVAYDLYPVVQSARKYGLGRIGWLKNEVRLAEFAHLLKQQLDVPVLKIVGNLNAQIKRVAVCGGSGGSLIKIAHKKGAEVFVTGEISYHEGQLAKDLGLCVIVAGHWATEIPIVNYLSTYLTEQFKTLGRDVSIVLAQTKTEPFLYI